MILLLHGWHLFGILSLWLLIISIRYSRLIAITVYTAYSYTAATLEAPRQPVNRPLARSAIADIRRCSGRRAPCWAAGHCCLRSVGCADQLPHPWYRPIVEREGRVLPAAA